MKFTKEQLSNAVWILAIILIVFTPVGFHARVFVGKIFAMDADIVEAGKQKTLTDYNWSLMDVEGGQMNFVSKKGEVSLVNFWATWCPPCVAELPSLEKLHNDYGDKVNFVFVTNEETEKVKRFLEKKGYSLPVYAENSRTPDEFFSRSIPATFVLNKSGKIVVDEKGAADWNSVGIRNLLDQLLEE
ncbi:TlpA family protein disulfide reductase [Flagellimonas sp. 2504JD4-2]